MHSPTLEWDPAVQDDEGGEDGGGGGEDEAPESEEAGGEEAETPAEPASAPEDVHEASTSPAEGPHRWPENPV